MKILLISAFPPNQKTGGQVFTLNAINELSQKHFVDIIYFNFQNHTCEIKKSENIRVLDNLTIRKFDFLKKFWIYPIFTRRFNKDVFKKLQEISSNYDALYFDFSQVALYSLYIKHPYKILRMHDVLIQKFQRRNFLLSAWVKNTEKKILQSFNKIFVPSKKDVELLKDIYGMNAFYTNEYLKSISIPNFVRQKKQFVFYGYWKRPENTDGLLWFIKNVIPLLKNNHEFLVIGGGLDNSLIEQYLKPHSIKYLGFVEFPLEIILQSSAVIVPLFQGAGIKIKVIDSFTVGTPVIGTELAFEGLPLIEKLSYEMNDAKDMAEIIDSFIPLTFEEKKQEIAMFNSLYNNHHLLEQI